MPRIADYTVVHQGSFTLEDLPGRTDRHIQNINCPAVNAGTAGVLTFRIDPEGDVTLQMRVNNTVVNRQLFNTTPQRTWHAVVAANTLRASGNELTASITSGPGKAHISDVVLQFQADIP